jgi:hypothetical protein
MKNGTGVMQEKAIWCDKNRQHYEPKQLVWLWAGIF